MEEIELEKRPQRKQTVMAFNHISKDLTPEMVKELSDLYVYYHKLATCYRWKYKTLKRLGIILNMSSIGLTVVGATVGGVTLNPIIIGVLTGCGVLVQGYITKSKLRDKTRECKFAYTSFNKTLIQLRGFLRGMSFDETVFLSDVKVLSDIIADSCPPISEKGSEKYNKRYKIKIAV